MKRIIMITRSVMTLMTCVYYSARIKEYDKNIRTVLIWDNPTAYKIPVQMFQLYFDEIHAIPSMGGWLMPSMESVEKYFECKRYLNKSGLETMLKEPCEREILMVGLDNNGFVKNVMDIISKKRNPHKIVLYEEGLALYDEHKRSLKEIVEYHLGKKGVYKGVVGRSHRVNTIFAQWPEELPEWKRKNRTIVLQSDVFSNKEIFNKIVMQDKHLKKMADALSGKKILLYLGTPISELSKSFRMKQEIGLLNSLIQALPEEYVILIKGHPREPVNKYKRFSTDPRCVLFDKNAAWYPIEVLLPLFHIKAVVSCSSSAAMNLAERIDGCRAIFTYKYLNVEIPEAWVRIFENAGKSVLIPKTKEEIWDAVNSDLESAERTNTKKINAKRNGKDVRYLLKYLEA